MLSASIRRASRIAALGLVVLFFTIGGVGHFVATDSFVHIVPPWVPFPREVVYLTGVLELLGAIGVCLRRWRRAAGLGLLALTVCVTPANVHMWLNPALFPDVSAGFLFWRLPGQLVLLGLIWWSTQGLQRPRAENS
jgi:uncharacterized membrane protein